MTSEREQEGDTANPFLNLIGQWQIDVDRIRRTVKINPEIKSEAPVTSIVVYLLTSSVVTITPPAKANADNIAYYMLQKSKSVHAVSMISNKITWTDDHIHGYLTFLGLLISAMMLSVRAR